MSSPTSNRRRDPGGLTAEALGGLAFVIVAVVGGGGTYAAVRLGRTLEQGRLAAELALGMVDGAPPRPWCVTLN